MSNLQQVPPLSPEVAVSQLMQDIKRLKDKARMLHEHKIPLDEYFKNLEEFSEYLGGILHGSVRVQLEEAESQADTYKKLMEQVDRDIALAAYMHPSNMGKPAINSIVFSEPRDRPNDEGF